MGTYLTDIRIRHMFNIVCTKYVFIIDMYNFLSLSKKDMPNNGKRETTNANTDMRYVHGPQALSPTTHIIPSIRSRHWTSLLPDTGRATTSQ